MTGRSRLLLLILGATAIVLTLIRNHGTTAVLAQGEVLWFADHEEPGQAHWYYPGGLNFGGGEFDSGCAGTTFTVYDNDPNTPNVAPPPGGGNFGLVLSMTAPCGGLMASGTRLFRWKEPIEHPDLYYKVWYYFPRNYTLVGSPDSWFWNIFGWKSKTINPPRNEVFWHVNVYNRPNGGSMYLQLQDAQTGEAPQPLATINVPVNQWFYLEAYYESRDTPTGRVTIWQGDGANRTLLWDLAGVQTRFADGWTEWYVSNYGSGLDSQPALIGIDNAEIRLP
jgi:hypothetical protein